MIKENGLSFKDLEKKIYELGCQVCRMCAKEILERYDRQLMEQRDKAKYRNKGLRCTTIKTIFGEVDYRRTVYEVTDGVNGKRFVYLLDENLELDPVGLISTNMVELMVQGITELSYRECAAKISTMTGQSISAMGVWNVIQALGEKVCREEEELVKAHKAGKLHGEKEVPVLFEEADGVYVKLQGKDRKDLRKDKAEIKVGKVKKYKNWHFAGSVV